MVQPGSPYLQATTILTSVNCYFAVYDRDSPLHRVTTWRDAWTYADELKPGPGERLFCFNQFWIEQFGEESALVWTILFPGVYRIDVSVSTGPLPDDSDAAFLGNCGELLLRCPTGKLFVSNADEIGQSGSKPILVVPPGRYRARLSVDREAVERHMELETVTDYPAEEGPDWIVHLQLVDCGPGS